MNDNNTALVAAEPQQSVTLFRTDDPTEIVAKATGIANTLGKVIQSQKLYTQIGPTRHVRVEGWTLCGTMLGVFAATVWTRPLDNGAGWEARVEARLKDGSVVGAAEAQCSRDEGRPWNTRPDYALRSMAQTRATSKALRLPLGFIVALAGFDATPAEEMAIEGEVVRRQEPPSAPPKPTPATNAKPGGDAEQALLEATLTERFGRSEGEKIAWLTKQDVTLKGGRLAPTINALSATECSALIAMLNREMSAVEPPEAAEQEETQEVEQAALPV